MRGSEIVGEREREQEGAREREETTCSSSSFTTARAAAAHSEAFACEPCPQIRNCTTNPTPAESPVFPSGPDRFQTAPPALAPPATCGAALAERAVDSPPPDAQLRAEDGASEYPDRAVITLPLADRAVAPPPPADRELSMPSPSAAVLSPVRDL